MAERNSLMVSTLSSTGTMGESLRASNLEMVLKVKLNECNAIERDKYFVCIIVHSVGIQI